MLKTKSIISRLIKKVPRISLLILLILLLFAACPPYASARMLMTPYLQAVTSDSIYVLVESTSAGPVTVEFGKTPSYGNSAQTQITAKTNKPPHPTYIHKIKLAGLEPNTRYYYRVSQPGGDPASGFSFITAVKRGTPFRFAWMADSRYGTAVHGRIATAIKNANPHFYLHGGDICESPAYEAFKKEFFIPEQLALISQVPSFLSPGNHEKWSVNTKAFTRSPQSPSKVQDYYSFDYGDAHMVCINTQLPLKEGTPQYRFVEETLRNTDQTWKIVFSHIPAYSAGGNPGSAGMRQMTAKIFEPYGVDLVISGHSHFYQHNLVNGIHHFIIGCAGAGLYAPSSADYVVKSVKDYNYAIFDVTPTTLEMIVYNDRGQELDALRLAKEQPARQIEPVKESEPMKQNKPVEQSEPAKQDETAKETEPIRETEPVGDRMDENKNGVNRDKTGLNPVALIVGCALLLVMFVAYAANKGSKAQG